ncbi:hypothetical protein ACSBLW_17850 [Thioclava sp. FR2]|uniref:hypothetical protein n=1 Tax=Thioclava sp. FR2 TaxID=3445780 RepID=UPI003EB6F445
MTKSQNPAMESLAQQIVSTLSGALVHPMSPEAQDAVSQAHEQAVALLALIAPQESMAIDLSTFDRLMQIAGPETAPSLLQQILIDLGTIRDGLNSSAPALDWMDLRNQSHVLISIAGSLGAERLGGLAEDLNRLANRSDAQQLNTILPTLFAELDALLDFVRGRATSLPSD